MHDLVAQSLLEQLRGLERLGREQVALQRAILRHLNRGHDDLVGGSLAQIPEGGSMSLVPIQPGQTPVFQVTPTFSGAPFTTAAAQAAVTSSDAANFPVELVPTDPTGLTFQAPIPATATPTGGDEAITVTWTYTNLDNSVATVTGTVTESGITDDVTGGSFAQIV